MKNKLYELVKDAIGQNRRTTVSREDKEKNAVICFHVALIVLGGLLALLGLEYDDSWVTRSPLLNLLGAMFFVVYLSLGMVAGLLWWVLTGSAELYEEAIRWMPFGHQPYRSSGGIFLAFILLAFVCHYAFVFLERFAWFRRNREWILCSLVWVMVFFLICALIAMVLIGNQEPPEPANTYRFR